MTDISKRNLVDFWTILADADLGTKVSPVAAEIGCFFESLLAGECNGRYSTTAFTAESRMAAYLRGFQCDRHPDTEDFYMVCCLDLHSVVMSEFGLMEFFSWMVTSQPYSGSTMNWLWRRQDIERRKMSQKTGRTRK
jgi:hypothetical protein